MVIYLNMYVENITFQGYLFGVGIRNIGVFNTLNITWYKFIFNTIKPTYHIYLSIKFFTYFQVFSFYLKHNYHSSFRFKQKKTNISVSNLLLKLESIRVSINLVPMVGLEPTRYCYHWILSPTCLPIPPHRHI